MSKILIVDGMSLLFRAFYAMPVSMLSPDGKPTGALYGFTRLLLSSIDSENPDKVIVCLDSKGKTFRHSVDEQYKANRSQPPDELRDQITRFSSFLKELGLTSFSCPGFEADDIIATIAKSFERKGDKSVIVTGDRDMLQLLTDSINVLITTNQSKPNIKYSPATLREEYGFSTEEYLWFKALKGDSSDNYKGVPRIGEKTARKIVAEANSLNEIKNHPKVLPHLALFEKALLLAEIRDNANIDKDCLNDTSSFIPQKRIDVFKKYGFLSLVSKYREKKTDIDVRTIKVDQIDDIIIKPEGQFALFIADDEVSYADSRQVFKVDIGSGIFRDADTAVKSFSRVLDSKEEKVVLDLKRILKSTSISEPVFDVGLAAYLDDPTSTGYDFEKLVSKYTDDALSNPRALLVVAESLKNKLKDKNQLELLNEVEIPLARVLYEIEKRGVLVDRDILEIAGDEMEAETQRIQKEIFSIAGTEFNISSPKQLSHILFEKIGLKPDKKTKTGYSTSASVLEKFKPQSPIVSLVMDYRELCKLVGTYIKPLPRYADSDGRIHTTFIQNGTSTGRLSSANPNLQNIPIRSQWGASIRSAFIAPDGYLLLDADYSQIELRILAHLSGDEGLIEAFRDGHDIHTYTARKIFDTENISSQQRRSAKVINFGILYGMSAHRLSNELDISMKDAKQFIDDYFDRFNGIRDYIDSVVESATVDGYTQTILGRRRNMPELASENFNIRSFGKRVAVNAPIQGSAADIIKLAMLDVEKTLEGSGARQILQIHDELIVECPEDKAEMVANTLKVTMENVFKLDVPLTVDVGWGKNWLVAK